MDLGRVTKRRWRQGRVGMRSETAVSTSAWLIGALSLGLGAGTAIGVLAYELKMTDANYGRTALNMQPDVRRQDNERSLHIVLYEQVRQWSDTIFRGQHAEYLGTYSDQFRAATTSVSEMGLALRSSVPDTTARRLSEQLLRAKSSVRNDYEAALKSFTGATAWKAREIDQTVKGKGRTPTHRIEEVAVALTPRVNTDAASQMDVVTKTTLVVSLAVLAGFALVAMLVGFAVPEISCTLRRVAGSWVGGRREPRACSPLLDMAPTSVRLEYPEI